MDKRTADGVLSGRIERKVDSLGRFRVPAKWFRIVGQDRFVVIMADPEEMCLRMIPSRVIEAKLEKLRERTKTDPETIQALMTIASASEHLKVDDEGCIEVSRKLLDFAGIKRRLVVVGGGKYTQLWSPKELRRRGRK